MLSIIFLNWNLGLPGWVRKLGLVRESSDQVGGGFPTGDLPVHKQIQVETVVGGAGLFLKEMTKFTDKNLKEEVLLTVTLISRGCLL